jgi:hypothetical protein
VGYLAAQTSSVASGAASTVSYRPTVVTVSVQVDVMADIGDLGWQGSALISAGWAGRKLLGPLFDEIAEDWRQRYSEHRLRNLNRIGQKAQAKLGDSIDDEGEVPPRIAAVVMDSGSWCDAEVMSEYFGGILAASRSPDVADDRGVKWANLVAGLATYDIYLHYLIYEAFRRLFIGRGLELGKDTVQLASRIYLPAADVMTVMGLEPSDEAWDAKWDLVSSALMALQRTGLISNSSALGSAGLLRELLMADIPEDGMVLAPSTAGIELFLWAHGYRHAVTEILSESLTMEAVADLPRVDAARELEVLVQQQRERLERGALSRNTAAAPSE